MRQQGLATSSSTLAVFSPLPSLVAVDPQVLAQSSTPTKRIHWIRHAEGYHNVNRQYRDIANLDARLTSKGIGQCQRLSQEIQRDGWLVRTKPNDLLVVTSPLTRCVQTALAVLEQPLSCLPHATKIVAHESLRETVNYNCDRRRKISEIAKEFPRVDFSLVKRDEDEIWKSYEERLGDDEAYPRHRESSELYKVADRGRECFRWLELRPESSIVVCTHSAFLRCILNFGYGVPDCPEQVLDERTSKINEPVVAYDGDATFEAAMRADFVNCELRSMLVSFSNSFGAGHA